MDTFDEDILGLERLPEPEPEAEAEPEAEVEPESEPLPTQLKKTNVGNDESKRWRFGRGTDARVELRINACYAYILEGGTRRQITARMVERFSCSQRTADEYYRRASNYLKTEAIEAREGLLNQIQALRMATVKKALQSKQFGTVQLLLKDMGAVIGEALPEQIANTAPVLSITVQDARPHQLPQSEVAEVVEVEAVAPEVGEYKENVKGGG